MNNSVNIDSDKIRKLNIYLRRQTNNNSVQNQDYNLTRVNQPACFIYNKMRHLARHCNILQDTTTFNKTLQEYQAIRFHKITTPVQEKHYSTAEMEKQYKLGTKIF